MNKLYCNILFLLAYLLSSTLIFAEEPSLHACWKKVFGNKEDQNIFITIDNQDETQLDFEGQVRFFAAKFEDPAELVVESEDLTIHVNDPVSSSSRYTKSNARGIYKIKFRLTFNIRTNYFTIYYSVFYCIKTSASTETRDRCPKPALWETIDDSWDWDRLIGNKYIVPYSPKLGEDPRKLLITFHKANYMQE